jgi:hypothetical protein
MLLLTLTNYVIVHCHLLRGHAWPFIEGKCYLAKKKLMQEREES